MTKIYLLKKFGLKISFILNNLKFYSIFCKKLSPKGTQSAGFGCLKGIPLSAEPHALRTQCYRKPLT